VTARLGVVLVEPVSDGNVGSVARVMANFGVDELAVVGRCPLTEFTRAMACHAWDVVERRREFPSLARALAGFDLSVATTAQRGDSDRHPLRAPTQTPEQLAARLGAAGGRVALVLGREDRGLTAGEVGLCDVVCTIPTPSDYGSLNVSHALAILLYALRPGAPAEYELASGKLMRALYRRGDALVSAMGYPEGRARKAGLVLRRVLGRAGLTSQEAHTLNGVLRDADGMVQPPEGDGSRNREARPRID